VVAASTRTQLVFAYQRDNVVCLGQVDHVVHVESSACTPTKVANNEGDAAVGGDTRSEVAGATLLLPNGIRRVTAVDTNGRSETFGVRNNIVIIEDRKLASVRYVARDGRGVVINVTGAGSAASEGNLPGECDPAGCVAEPGQ
jgi:hypothetical protein